MKQKRSKGFQGMKLSSKIAWQKTVNDFLATRTLGEGICLELEH